MYRITQLARKFGLSRSTLLHYDRIGLLSPSGRSGADYRLYSQAECERLETICAYRRAGLTIEDIRLLLDMKGNDTAVVLQRRLKLLGEEILAMQTKQRLLARMLRITASGGPQAGVDKETWVEMLRAAGMDNDAMERWHAEFERRAPDAHQQFLLSLGLDEKEVSFVRKCSAGFAPSRLNTRS